MRARTGALKGMDLEILKSIIALVAAIIPLIVLIITLFRNYIDRTTEPVDSPLLKVVYLKRLSVDDKVWEKQKSRYDIYIIAACIYMLIYFIFIADTQPHDPLHIFTNPFVVGALFYILIALYLIIYTYRMGSAGPESVRYFLFKHLDLIIVAEYQYLFNKCHDTLKALGWKILEIDEHQHILKAWYIPYFTLGRLVDVRIEHVENSESAYLIKIAVTRLALRAVSIQYEDQNNLTRTERFAIRLRRVFISKEKDALENQRRNLLASSKVINRFVNRLISKPKN